MKRRDLLGTAGAVVPAALAGCLGGSGSTSPTATPTDTTPAGTARTATATEPSTSETAERGSPTGTASSTPTVSPAAFATVEGHLVDVRDRYVGFGSGETIAAPLAKDALELRRIHDSLGKARATLDDIRGHTLSADRQKRYAKLDGAYWLLALSVSTSVSLHTAYEHFTQAWGEILAGDEDTDGALRRVRSHTDDAAASLEQLRRETDPSDATAVDGITRDAYEERLSLFRTEIEQFRTIAGQLETLGEGLSTVALSATDYRKERYAQAATGFASVHDSFTALESALGEPAWTPSFTPVVDEARCVVTATTPACDDLEAAAIAGKSGHANARENAKEAAKEHFQQCRLVVEEVGAYDRLY